MRELKQVCMKDDWMGISSSFDDFGGWAKENISFSASIKAVGRSNMQKSSTGRRGPLGEYPNVSERLIFGFRGYF